jgi:hypothetical protein
MRAMSLGCLLLVATACGPSMKPDHVKTADEQIADQERAQIRSEREGQFKEKADVDTKEIDEESRRKFDQRQAELELKRAARSAETCPGAIGATEKDQPKGEAEVTMVFGNDGNVKSVAIGAPFEGTKVGKCAKNAFESVIVPSFVGPEQPMNWKVDLTGKAVEEKKDKDQGKDKKK